MQPWEWQRHPAASSGRSSSHDDVLVLVASGCGSWSLVQNHSVCLSEELLSSGQGYKCEAQGLAIAHHSADTAAVS